MHKRHKYKSFCYLNPTNQNNISQKARKIYEAGAKITDVRITPYDKDIFNECKMAAYIYYEAEKEIEL